VAGLPRRAIQRRPGLALLAAAVLMVMTWPLLAPAVAVVLAALACAPRLAPDTPPRPIVLAVVSWNMDAGGGDLSRLVVDLSSGRLTRGPVPGVLLLVQEATEQGVREAAAASGSGPLSLFFTPALHNPPRTGNAILSSMPLADARVIDLPRERRSRTAAIAMVEVGGHRLFVASTHLENRLGWQRGFFADRARKRQADALLRALPAAGHGILGGDMNTMFPNESALAALLDRFDDTPREAPQPTYRGRLVLDHVFFDLPDGWTATRDVLQDRYGSDHHPVLGVVAIGER
jgi:endonuclease/exonuclease/phosphatase family metal-dependent hydrolase